MAFVESPNIVFFAGSLLTHESDSATMKSVVAREFIVTGASYEISSGTVDFSEEVATPPIETHVNARVRTNSTSHFVLPEPSEVKSANY